MASPEVEEAVARGNAVLPDFDSDAVDMKSLTLLSGLILHESPRVIVEAGTYQGHFAIQVGGLLAAYDLAGRIWTADPVDHGVEQRITDAGLRGRVYYHQATFETMLSLVPAPVDFAFIDATERDGDPLMRLKHVNMVLPMMRPGGLICVDDTRADWNGVETIRAMGMPLGGQRGMTVIRA